MKLKDSELKSILAEVETEIASLLKSEGAALKKAKDADGDDDGDSAPAEASAPAEGSAPAAEASAPEASGPEGSDPSAPAPAEASSPAPEASSPEASAPAADPAAEAGPVDPAALQAEYAKLAPEELKAHYMAAKAALFEMMGAAGAGAAGPEASAPAPAMAPPEASSPAAPPPAMKAEVPASIKDVPANGDATKDQKPAIPDSVKKSEAPLAKSGTEAKVADLEAQVELMAKALDIALGTPVRKAVTSVAFMPKTGAEAAPAKELSKSEIQDKIRKAMAGGKLTKSQKDQILSYSLGNLGLDAILPIIESK